MQVQEDCEVTLFSLESAATRNRVAVVYNQRTLIIWVKCLIYTVHQNQQGKIS